MALLDTDGELARAEDARPFASYEEAVTWRATWCSTCVHTADCPLLTVAFLDQIPFGWIAQSPESRHPYVCAEFTRRQDLP